METCQMLLDEYLNTESLDAEDRAQQLQNQKVTRRFQADVIESFMNEIRAFDLPIQKWNRDHGNSLTADTITARDGDRLILITGFPY